MTYVPSQLEIHGDFSSQEEDFSVWIAKNNCHGIILTNNLAIAECQINQEERILGDLSVSRPKYVKSIRRVEICPNKIGFI